MASDRHYDGLHIPGTSHLLTDKQLGAVPYIILPTLKTFPRRFPHDDILI